MSHTSHSYGSDNSGRRRRSRSGSEDVSRQSYDYKVEPPRSPSLRDSPTTPSTASGEDSWSERIYQQHLRSSRSYSRDRYTYASDESLPFEDSEAMSLRRRERDAADEFEYDTRTYFSPLTGPDFNTHARSGHIVLTI